MRFIGITLSALLPAVVSCATAVPPTRTISVNPDDANPDGIAVVISPMFGAGWALKVTNEGDAPIALDWDRSTLISGSTALGRLLRGRGRVLHSDESQPTGFIPPHTTLIEWFAPEADVDSNGAVAYRDGGHLYLTFIVDGEDEIWQADITEQLHYSSNSNASGKCFDGTTSDGSVKHLCFETSNACVAQRQNSLTRAVFAAAGPCEGDR